MHRVARPITISHLCASFQIISRRGLGAPLGRWAAGQTTRSTWNREIWLVDLCIVMPLRNIGGAALVSSAIDSALLCIRDWGIVDCGQHRQQMPVLEVLIASHRLSVHANLGSVG
ncbi:hypothetical protein HBI56_044990 [Parastagonospora nodorum]|nr:hypothetical protein HBH56_058110 [Parastagonospora nodorum]KAH3930793.1 hypothetical protein HBH54_102040 [Parastagonospora nodorum]KAH3943878.1 hypothetical protein HBH53_167790 [Parastagonospora nodorum]KAH3965498.1 hypothetical protein HBH51_150620 [Parastagonospora nodorum]KAH3977372.1 hypothetical protein HBH52_111140 [Parastagonospora nodorum]